MTAKKADSWSTILRKDYSFSRLFLCNFTFG